MILPIKSLLEGELLDLRPYVRGPDSDSALYELYAVSNHSGGLGGGHYTAYAKNFDNHKWYMFNDSSGMCICMIYLTAVW